MNLLSSRTVCLVICLLVGLYAVGCSQPEAAPTAVPATEPPATATNTPTKTAVPTATYTPTHTPTPAPLKPSEIFDRVSPAIAYIETELGTGSGVLLADGYILTNAHVVWPQETARVSFSDGSEHEDVPVVNWDLIGDLTVLGPIETDLPPLTLVDGEDLIVGSDVYLIGYPGEVETLPKPTITRGLISRFREWEPVGVTYFQTDASIGGGQSGGALVSEMGDVVGISGNSFSEAGFGLAASAVDIIPRVEGLIAGEDVDQLGNRFFNMENLKRTTTTANLRERWQQRTYIIDAEKNKDIEINFDGDNTDMWLMDPRGQNILYLDDQASGKHTVETAFSGPHFLSVFTKDNGIANITSNYELIRFDDPDENKGIKVNETLFANLDFPGDSDFYSISLKKGDIVHISADSMLIDPVILVSFLNAEQEQELLDDDSGGGIFGMSAEMTYEAPQDSLYDIVVFDAGAASNSGGYILTVRPVASGDPTPQSPEPTPTPIASEFGEMTRYESLYFPFSIQHLAEFDDSWVARQGMASFCTQATACFANEDGLLLIITEEDINQSQLTFDEQSEYVEYYISFLENTFDYVEIKHTTSETLQGKTIDRIDYTIGDGVSDIITVRRLFFLHKNVGFNATYVIDPLAVDETVEEMIDYSFSTFRLD